MPIEFLLPTPPRQPTTDTFQAARLQLWMEVFQRTLPRASKIPLSTLSIMQGDGVTIEHIQHAAGIAAAAVQAFDRQFSTKPEQEAQINPDLEEPFK